MSSKTGKGGRVPELRFPEFRDSPGWELAPLGTQVTKVGSGITPKGGDKYYKKVGRPFLRSQNIGWGHLILDNMAFIEEETHLSFSGTEIREHDIFLNITGASIGRCAVASAQVQGGNVNQHVCIIRTKRLQLNPYFLNQYLLSQYGQSQIDSFQAGGNRQGLNFSQVRSFLIPLPTKDEQQKIADCLASIDELIAAHTQKLDALKKYKKGLMQQLFPAEGKTLPNLRFPQFRDAEKWEEQKIEALAKRGSGHTPNKIKTEYYDGGIKWVSLVDSKMLDNGYIYETKIKISKEGLENSSAVLHPPGTVIISRDAAVGKIAILHSAMAVSQHFIAWQCNKSKLSNWFLYYLLQVLKPKFENIAMGSTIKTIGLPFFKEMRITIPSFPEQQKIADTLSSLDDLITGQTQKIASLKAHKKGLTQQLFPSVDEALG